MGWTTTERQLSTDASWHQYSSLHVSNNCKLCWAWATGEEPIIQPKTKDAGTMVSNFIEQHDGLCEFRTR